MTEEKNTINIEYQIENSITIEDIEAWKKNLLEKQFSDIFNRAAEWWRINSPYFNGREG